MSRRWPRREEDGATSTEYALMCTLITLMIVTSVALFGREVASLFSPVTAGI